MPHTFFCALEVTLSRTMVYVHLQVTPLVQTTFRSSEKLLETFSYCDVQIIGLYGEIILQVNSCSHVFHLIATGWWVV